MAGYLEATARAFANYRRLAERAMAQVDDDAFFRTIGRDTNSIAILVKHMAGNLRSRWTDFLTTDGEKPDRARDSEFELTAADTRASLMERWAAGWQLVEAQLAGLTDEDLNRTVTVRWEPFTVLEAIQTQLGHAAYHAGQIVLLARQLAPAWNSLSIPRGESDAFNARKEAEARAAGRIGGRGSRGATP